MRLDNGLVRTIFESSWLKWTGGTVIGLVLSIFTSFLPDAFWVHDNRQALSALVVNQPLIQRDIAELKDGMGELNITMKELTVEMQKRRAVEEIRESRRKK